MHMQVSGDGEVDVEVVGAFGEVCADVEGVWGAAEGFELVVVEGDSGDGMDGAEVEEPVGAAGGGGVEVGGIASGGGEVGGLPRA